MTKPALVILALFIVSCSTVRADSVNPPPATTSDYPLKPCPRC